MPAESSRGIPGRARKYDLVGARARTPSVAHGPIAQRGERFGAGELAVGVVRAATAISVRAAGSTDGCEERRSVRRDVVELDRSE
jgi:hypothetical protein